VLSSCVPQKKLRYVQIKDDKDKQNTYINALTSRRIKIFDELYIKVFSIDEKTAEIFSYESGIQYGMNIGLISYTVDENGTIDFPFIGQIYLKDYTLKEAKEIIQEELSQYLPNTSINIKFVNNSVSVLGEVNRQGKYDFFDEKINIFDAIALAGGLDRYGNRENVIVIRRQDEKVIYNYIDLTDKNIVSRDAFFILPEDVIIVEPLPAKSSSYGNITYTTALQTITTMITLLLFIRNYNQ
jgi:polysaccharide export outer membrane protein